MKTILMLLFVSLLSACAPETRIEVIKKPIFPELPPVQKPMKLQLETCELDYPRLTDSEVVEKNLTDCIQHADKNSADYQRRCVEYPVDLKSNLFIGFDQESWLCHVRNQQKIQLQLKIFDGLIDSVNKTRSDWIDRNQAAE